MMGFRRITRSARGRAAIVLVAVIGASGVGAASVATIVSSGAPAAAAVAHGAIAYVVRSDGVIQKIDTATNKKLGAPVGSEVYANDIAIAPDGATAYLPNPSISGVQTFATKTGAFGSVSGYGTGSPVAAAVSPDGTKLFVADDDDSTLRVVDLGDHSVQTFDFYGYPADVAVSPDGETAWVAVDTEGTYVFRVDLGEEPSFDYIGVPDGAYDLTVTPDGSAVYVASYYDGVVTRISTADDSTTPIPLPASSYPEGLAMAPDGSTVYVTAGSQGFVYPIETATDTVGDPINVGGYPTSLAVTPDGHSLYVSSRSNFSEGGFHPALQPFDEPTTVGETTTFEQPLTNGRVVVVDTATNTVVTKLALAGHDPYQIAIAPDQAPVARLAVAPGPVGSPSDFDASASTSSPSPITSYAWDFGDGDTTTTATPTVQHTYTSADAYTVTVTVTDAAGTSTEQVFTGQTMSRNGGESATTSREITVVACDANEPCGGSVSDGNQNVTVNGTSSTPATLSISMGVATVACGDGDVAKPREVVGLNPDNFTSADGLRVSFTFLNQHTLKKIPICYVSSKPFRTFHGEMVTVGLVPHCHGDPPAYLPCMLPPQLQGDNLVETIIVSPNDPKFWSKAKVKV